MSNCSKSQKVPKCPLFDSIWQYLNLKKVFVSYAKWIGWPVLIWFGYRITKRIPNILNNISQLNNLHKLTMLRDWTHLFEKKSLLRLLLLWFLIKVWQSRKRPIKEKFTTVVRQMVKYRSSEKDISLLWRAFSW